MLIDGYNRRLTLALGSKQLRIIYRPFHSMFSAERKRWRWEISFLSDDAKQRAIDQSILAQIVEWDLPYVHWSVAMLRQNEQAYSRLIRVINGVDVDDSGERWRDLEEPWALNLREGVILDLTNPRLARLSCDECQKYWYADGKCLISNSTGEKELRPMFALTACQTEFGCPKGTPQKQKSLNAANRWAWYHFRECQAMGSFPTDPIVRHNAKVIRKAIEAVGRENTTAATRRA